MKEWDRHSLFSTDYRVKDFWHTASWTEERHNDDGSCPHQCACCKSKAGAPGWFGACPVCNENLYSNARPVWAQVRQGLRVKRRGILE